MKRHAIEPWTIGDYGKVYPADCLHEPILVDGFALAMSEREEAKANAKRIVECVNACAEMEDPEKVIAKARQALFEASEFLKAMNIRGPLRNYVDEALSLIRKDEE